VWVVGDVDEEMPPLYFDCAEDAYRAYKRSQISMKLLAERRKKALQQIKLVFYSINLQVSSR